MERRTSRKRKSTSSNTRSSCVYSECNKKTNSNLSVDFHSETLSSSSPIKPDQIKKKARRKKIRSTQDFNQLCTSLTSQVSDASTKSDTKITKKRKNDVYMLPKINSLMVDALVKKKNKSVDFLPNYNVHQEKKSKCKKTFTRKISNTKEHVGDEISISKNESVIQKNVKKNLKHKKDSSKDSSEEYETAASLISDSNREYDYEVEIKLKKKLSKKRDSGGSETARDQHYVQRIRRMLLNDCKLSSEESSDEGNLSNSRRSLPGSKFTKSRKNSNVSKTKNIQQIDDTENIRRSKRLSNILTINNEFKEQNEGKHLDSNSSDRASDELSEQGKYVRSKTNVTEKTRQSSSRKSNKAQKISNLSEHFIEVKETAIECNTGDPLDFTFKISNNEKLKSSENVSYALSNVDDAGEFDDVFDIEENRAENIQSYKIFNTDKSELKNNTQKQMRKSVRFASLTAPEQDADIRRITYDVNECTSSIKMFNEELERTSDNMMFKTDGTCEIGIPKINAENNSSPINNRIHQSMDIETPQETALNDFVDERCKLNETFELSSSKHFSASPKKLDDSDCNTIELLSPIYGKYPMKRTSNFSSSEKVCSTGKPLLSNSMAMISSQIDTNNLTSSENSNLNFKKSKSFREGHSRERSRNSSCSKSVIDLTTPHVLKFRKNSARNSDVILISSSEKSLEKSMERSLKKLCRESMPSKYDGFKEEQPIKEPNGTAASSNNLYIHKVDLDKNDDKNNSVKYFSDEQSSEKLKTPVAVDKLHQDSMSVKASSEKIIRDYPARNFSEIDVDKKLNTTFDYDETNSNSKVNLDLLENIENVQSTVFPKLNRTATFTKEDQDEKNITSDVQYNYSVVCDSPINKLLDTSKVTRRRQWDKSQYRMSLFDGSLDIGNISPPWKGATINHALENSQAKEFAQLCDSEKSTQWHQKVRTPPSSTSTPLLDRKNKLLKKVLLKDKNVTINDSKNISKSLSKPVAKLTRSKMPNFALIHQRANDKLESLKEMSERKAQRAKLLLSGCKPDNTSNMDLPEGKSKKFLQFSPAKSKKIPLNTSTNLNENEEKVMLTVANISITKIKNITPSKSNPKVVAKENKLTPVIKKKELLKVKSRIPTKLITNNVVTEKKGFTRYGFKVGSNDVRKTTKEEQLKAVASKTKVNKNTVDQRRNIIQGVRSNRRFELLMNLRNK